jgi:hypothetical protein
LSFYIILGLVYTCDLTTFVAYVYCLTHRWSATAILALPLSCVVVCIVMCCPMLCYVHFCVAGLSSLILSCVLLSCRTLSCLMLSCLLLSWRAFYLSCLALCLSCIALVLYSLVLCFIVVHIVAVQQPLWLILYLVLSCVLCCVKVCCVVLWCVVFCCVGLSCVCCFVLSSVGLSYDVLSCLVFCLGFCVSCLVLQADSQTDNGATPSSNNKVDLTTKYYARLHFISFMGNVRLPLL